MRKTVEELLAEARGRLERLDPAAALAAQRRGALLIDLRSHDERARHGVIPASLHVPRSVLEWRLDPVSPYRNEAACDLDRHIVLVCADGFSSSLAAATLQELGFARATDVIGGFSAWRAAGMPLIDGGPPEPEPFGMGAPDAVGGDEIR